jgi:hypothetical protein
VVSEIFFYLKSPYFCSWLNYKVYIKSEILASQEKN